MACSAHRRAEVGAGLGNRDEPLSTWAPHKAWPATLPHVS